MNNLGISTDPQLLSVDLPESLTASPSVSTFLPEEDASTCPLLPSTPSPPCMDFIHPLTPGTDNNTELTGDDPQAETSSSGSSSGIGIQVNATGASNLFHKHAYQHLKKNGDLNITENGGHQNGCINIKKTKGTPNFVSWNWSIIRKCTVFIFLSGLLAMFAIVVAKIIQLPKSCNPAIEWYRGGVFYEIFPASFQDSDQDGLGDLIGIESRSDYLQTLGISAVRLNSIFPSKNYPHFFENVTTLMAIDKVLGGFEEFAFLKTSLHSRNISLILDLPIFPIIKQLDPVMIRNKTQELNETERDNDNNNQYEILKIAKRLSNENLIVQAMLLWLSKGVDGFYVKGLENYVNDPYFLENIREWKYLLGKDRILILSYDVFEKILDESVKNEVLQYVDLVDVYLDVSNGTKFIDEQINKVIEYEFHVTGKNPWIHWSIGGVEERRLSTGLTSNITLASTLMQLLLPGTPSIFYGDEISLQEAHDPRGEHRESKHLHHLSAMAWNTIAKFTTNKLLPWLPKGAPPSFFHVEYVANMIALRRKSPSIYQHSFMHDGKSVINTASTSKDGILIVVRWYPRRNTFVSVSNFNSKPITVDLSGKFYSGIMMLGPQTGEQIFFNNFAIAPMETLIFKLDK